MTCTFIKLSFLATGLVSNGIISQNVEKINQQQQYRRVRDLSLEIFPLLMMSSAQVVETSVDVITTVLLRTTLTRTIIIYRPMVWLLASNHLQFYCGKNLLPSNSARRQQRIKCLTLQMIYDPHLDWGSSCFDSGHRSENWSCQPQHWVLQTFHSFRQINQSLVPRAELNELATRLMWSKRDLKYQGVFRGSKAVWPSCLGGVGNFNVLLDSYNLKH